MARYKSITTIIFFFVIQWSLFAQPGQGRRLNQRMEAIDSRRIAYITRSLSLSPAEARVFWPVYNEYLRKLEEMNQKHRAWQQQVESISRLSDSEAALVAEREIKRLEEHASLRRAYHEKLKEVMPIQKIAMLYEAERSFNSTLFRESQHRMRGRP